MALSGMTGFARIDGAQGTWRWTLEARSVNGRTLEARFRGPQGFDALERMAREAAQARFQRGQIQISLTAKQDALGKSITINSALLDQYLDLCSNWVASGQADKPRADGLLALRGVLDQADEQDDPDLRAAVEAAMARDLAAVLDALKAARQAEGQGLLPVLTQHMDAIAARIEAAEAEATAQTDAIRERFTRRLNELLPETP
ncbi:MAG: YicC/YloC family endoribonuclease, partial [Asticcacaulis sp.]